MLRVFHSTKTTLNDCLGGEISLVPVGNATRILTDTTGGLFVHDFPPLLGVKSWTVTVNSTATEAVGVATLFDGTTQTTASTTIPESGIFTLSKTDGADVYYVRLGVDSTVFANGVLSFEYVVPFNNVIGMTEYDVSALPKTQYRSVFLLSDTTEMVNISQVAHDGEILTATLEFGADAEGEEIQTIASGTTAPSGITFNTTASVSLTANVPRAVWIKNTLDAQTSAGIYHSKIKIENSALDLALRGAFKVADATLEGWCLYAGGETDSSGGELVAFSDTLPIAYPVTLPSAPDEDVYNFRLTRRNKYGIESLNWHLDQNIILDSEGDARRPKAPDTLTVENTKGGALRVVAATTQGAFEGGWYWRISYTVNGGAATTEDVALLPHNENGISTLDYALTAFDWGDVVAVTVRLIDAAARVGDASIETVTVNTASLPAWRNTVITAETRGNEFFSALNFVVDTGDLVVNLWPRYEVNYGVAALRKSKGGDPIMRINTFDGLLAIDIDGYAVSDDYTAQTGLAANAIIGIGTLISKTGLYLAVNGVGVVKVDYASGTIYTPSLGVLTEAECCPVPAAVYTTQYRRYFQVCEPATNKWTTAFAIDSRDGGTMLLNYAIWD